MDQHELVIAIKDLALELGRTPTRNEARERIFSLGRKLNAVQWTYSNLIAAAGLVPATKERITNKVFEVDIDRHLTGYEPKPIIPHVKWPEILVVGDTHFPFVHKKALESVHVFAKENKPKWIVQIGDLMDCYSHSKFPRSHNIFTPQQEEQSARKMAEEMWDRFRADCPDAKLVQLCGNHDYRPMKRALENVPTMEHWIEKYLKELLTFEGVQTVFDPRDEFKIADITFIHGHLGGTGKHRDHFLGNVVCGHTHTGNVSLRQLEGKVVWELNCGYLGDQYAKGLAYTPTKTVLWTLGFGWIDQYGCRFISF